jgi:hypothetical protein
MSALFNDVHNTNTTDVNDVKLRELVGTHVTGRMLAAYQRHTTTDVDDMPDTTDGGDVIPPWAFSDHEEDMTFDPWG